MDEWQDSLNSILSDPEQMEKIAGLAKSLMGSSGETPAAPPEKGALLSSVSQNESREEALLRAMQPYLSQRRRGKLERAMKLARVARLAGMSGLLGSGDGHDPPL